MTLIISSNSLTMSQSHCLYMSEFISAQVLISQVFTCRFYQSWEKFKDNNPYVNKVLDWKIKYDESENPVIRASRLLTNKVCHKVFYGFQNIKTVTM